MSKECLSKVFTSIGHLIDVELQTECRSDMDGKKAVGIDGITKDMYEDKLKENLANFVIRLKAKSYRLKPSKRIEIPKDNGNPH